MTSKPGIVTVFVNPPLPYRSFDWLAHYDDQIGEKRPIGTGETEAAAIAELKRTHPR